MRVNDDLVAVTFQWTVGDSAALEKMIAPLARVKGRYAITVLSRIIAFALTFGVASLIFPEVDLFKIFALVLAASLTIWVSFGLHLISVRKLERLSALDPRRVGWNKVEINKTGIYWSDDVSLQYVSWMGVRDVVEADGALWFKTAEAAGFYLPARVFESPEVFEECARRIAVFRSEATAPAHVNPEKGAQLH
jgi:hypothetical protein